jgi:hypothetical protein
MSDAEYEPSPGLRAALDAYNRAQEAADDARDQLRAAVADDLKTYYVTNDVLATHLPWSGETIRGIAREYGVPPKRKPTVRSIKPRRRTDA